MDFTGNIVSLVEVVLTMLAIALTHKPAQLEEFLIVNEPGQKTSVNPWRLVLETTNWFKYDAQNGIPVTTWIVRTDILDLLDAYENSDRRSLWNHLDRKYLLIS